MTIEMMQDSLFFGLLFTLVCWAAIITGRGIINHQYAKKRAHIEWMAGYFGRIAKDGLAAAALTTVRDLRTLRSMLHRIPLRTEDREAIIVAIDAIEELAAGVRRGDSTSASH